MTILAILILLILLRVQGIDRVQEIGRVQRIGRIQGTGRVQGAGYLAKTNFLNLSALKMALFEVKDMKCAVSGLANSYVQDRTSLLML